MRVRTPPSLISPRRFARTSVIPAERPKLRFSPATPRFERGEGEASAIPEARPQRTRAYQPKRAGVVRFPGARAGVPRVARAATFATLRRGLEN